MTDLNISFVSLFWVSAARRRRSTMATWIMSMSQDKAFGQWPWIDFFTPNISHMLAAANFHRSSRSFWENYFQLCHDYSCKCRNVRLTALSLTADDQEIGGSCAGHADRKLQWVCTQSLALLQWQQWSCYGQDTHPAELAQPQEDTCTRLRWVVGVLSYRAQG